MKEYKRLIPREKNILKKGIFSTNHSNSQNHIKDISNYNYEHRIRLNPLGEDKSMEIRHQIPTNKIHDLYIKSNILYYQNQNMKNAYEKAELQSKISSHIKKQNHQNLLKKEKNIKKFCTEKNNEIKKEFNNKKNRLKQELTRIIKDTLSFSKKNNPIRSMLPDNINEIVERVKKETQDLSQTLSISHISKISKVSSAGVKSGLQKNDFLNMLGVDVENLNSNNINIDIDKCWNFVHKLSKGKNIEDILRYKVVNEIMNITEKKSSEKAKKIYEKLDIYKKYMAGKKGKEYKKKLLEEEKKKATIRMNPSEYIKQKIQKSLSQPKLFNQIKLDLSDKKKKKGIKPKIIKKNKNKKKLKRSKSVILPDKRGKKLLRYNAYNDVDKIIDFIDKSKSNSQCKNCRSHFSNIQMTKNIINISMQEIKHKKKFFYK